MLQPQGSSNERSQDMFSFRNKKNYLSVILNTLSHLKLWYVKVKDRTSLPQGLGWGVWFPAHCNITCIDKDVKIKSTNQWIRISRCDDFIGWQYEIERQIDTVNVTPPYLVPSMSLNLLLSKGVLQ